jgi:hypothetical protein
VAIESRSCTLRRKGFAATIDLEPLQALIKNHRPALDILLQFQIHGVFSKPESESPIIGNFERKI